MGTFDSILEQFGDSAADLFGGDAGDLLDNVNTRSPTAVRQRRRRRRDAASGWTDTLGGLFGGVRRRRR